jgi:GTP-sensing pleiotropic transcriptional regulator CodY
MMSDAPRMFARAMESFKNDGKLDVEEMEQILGIALIDGKLDSQEKAILKNIVFKLSKNDFSRELWSRVEQIVEDFELDK